MFYQPYSTDWKSYQKENLLGTGFQQILQTGCPETNLIYMGEMYRLQWVLKICPNSQTPKQLKTHQ